MLKKLFPRKKKGFFETMLGSLIAIFVMVTLVFVLLVDLKPFFINLQLHEVDRQASLRMETDGGLTQTTKDYIINSLSNMSGFEESNLVITPSNTADDTHFASYGDPVSLTLTYKYTPKKYHLIGWTQIKKEDGDVMPITVHWDTTSKRIKTISH